ncbi:MAG TPA: hydroxysqualene dehydroxylase HpnE [Acidisarcina sp.]
MASSTLNAKAARSSVVVIGGGVAGIAAACALADAGFRVQLLERRPYLGGRASSYEHPGTGEVIDNCQHILLGSCTNLIDLYERLGVASSIRWFDRFTFIEPGGRCSVLQPSWLPAPLHSSLSFLGAHAFSAADKLALSRGLSAFLLGVPGDSEENFADWLVRHKQTPAAIERFWKPVLVSALNEEMERISVHYAGKVIRETFLRSAEAGRMGVPSVPLSELYGRAVDYIEARGGSVHVRASAESFERMPAPGAGKSDRWLVRSADADFAADAVVLALSFEGMAAMLPHLPGGDGATGLGAQLGRFEHSPITGIHLWFDREITDLEHAVLLDTTIQWMYNKSKLQQGRHGAAGGASGGSYLELVVSASRSMVPMQRQEIIDLAVRELALFFPAVREATLLKAAVVKEVRATYSIRPGLDAFRPGAVSPWPGIFLAGDWTATGWPATMEGAVRSGYLAGDAVLAEVDRGSARSFVRPDLPAAGLMRLVK